MLWFDHVALWIHSTMSGIQQPRGRDHRYFDERAGVRLSFTRYPVVVVIRYRSPGPVTLCRACEPAHQNNNHLPMTLS